MINQLRARYRNEQFTPTWLSLFVNSNYLIRRGIYEGIKTNAPVMSGVMLDFGCGTKPYKKLFNVEKYVGIDIKNDAHDNDLSFVDVFYDGRHIPFEDGYFDSIYSSEVITHISDVEPVMAEIARVLKPGGKMLLTVPFVWHENEQPNDAVRYTSFGIINLLERHGLKVLQHKKYGSYFTTSIQTRNAYLYHALFPKSALLKFILTLIFIAPYNILAAALAPVLGKNQDLFSNMVIIAEKRLPDTP